MTSELRVARSALHFWEEPPISGEGRIGHHLLLGLPLGVRLLPEPRDLRGRLWPAGHDGAPRGDDARAPECRSAQHKPGDGPAFCPAGPRGGRPRSRGRARAADCLQHVRLRASGGRARPRGHGRRVAHRLKYASSTLAGELSAAPDYPDAAASALAAMLEGVAARAARASATTEGCCAESSCATSCSRVTLTTTCAVLDRVWDIAGNDADLSLMNQYTPNERCRRAGGELARGRDRGGVRARALPRG